MYVCTLRCPHFTEDWITYVFRSIMGSADADVVNKILM